MPIPKILKDLLALPTATYVEDAVVRYVREFCKRTRGVKLTTDRYGNLLARYRFRPRKVPTLAFSAHMDHPGFVSQEMVDKRTVRAAFRGGVRAEFFTNARAWFWTGNERVPARVLEITKANKRKRGKMVWEVPTEALLRVNQELEPNLPGMWNLPEAFERRGNVYGRDCDDIAGCAAMLELLARLSRKNAHADVCCLFTRAEEVGFIGAIAACKARTLSKKWPLIAIETSSELPNARIGDGPILRVGDRMSIFDPDVTAFCGRVAERLASRRKSFQYQRKLMDGGACESTAYVNYGYPATGICLALGNYHNMNLKSGRIDSEYVSLRDYRQMVDWFEAIAMDDEGFVAGDPKLRAELDKSLEKAEGMLLG